MTPNRREFLKSAGLAALGFAGLEASANDSILVVLLLHGGNDGLNTVVPIGDAQYDLYQRLRPNLKVARDQVLKLSGIDQEKR